MSRYLFTALLLLSLVGCATGIDPKTLRPVSLAKSFEVPTLVTFHKKRGLGFDTEEGLMPGTYTAELEDTDGIYYRGPEDCVYFKHEGLKQRIMGNGGIWIPKSAAKASSMRVYAYIERKNNPGDPKAGVLINALIDNDIGRINFSPAIEDQAFIQTVSKLAGTGG